MENVRQEHYIQDIYIIFIFCKIVIGILRFFQCGGIECVTDILTDNTSNEEEKREAAGFIAQITSPTLENNHHISGLAESIPSLIRSLTGRVLKSINHAMRGSQ